MRFNFDLLDLDFFKNAFSRLTNVFSDPEEFDCPLKGTTKSNDTGFVVRVEVPGFEKENIKVSYHNPYLSIAAEQKEEGETKRFYYKSYLPEVDATTIDAGLRNGILTLTVAKKPEEQPQQIDIKVGE